MSDSVEKMCACALTLDMSPHQAMSYLDVCLRSTMQFYQYNFHLILIPIFERHIAGVMLNILSRVLDTMSSHGKHVTIVVSTDGAKNMIGFLSGLATCIQNVCNPGMIWARCKLYQLDLVMQAINCGALGKILYSISTVLIKHFQRQQNQISGMRFTCPEVAIMR